MLCAALNIFYKNNKALPLSGSLPDMTSTTDYFLTLQNIYQDKAKKDKAEFIGYLQEIMT